jgi:hypothetical protein
MGLNEKQKQLIGELFSGSEATSIKAIKQLKEDGNEDVLIPLFDLLVTTGSEVIKEEILILLNNVKNKSAVDIYIKAISNPKYSIYKPELIAACWENGLDYSNYLSFFVEQVISEDFLVGIEAITVIETFNPPYNNEEISLNIDKLEKAYLAADSIKQPMLQSLAKLLNERLNSL